MKIVAQLSVKLGTEEAMEPLSAEISADVTDPMQMAAFAVAYRAMQPIGSRLSARLIPQGVTAMGHEFSIKFVQ